MEDWKELRELLKTKDIQTYYAVHSDGHSDGWAGLTTCLRERIKEHMDEIRHLMHNSSDEIESAKLRGRITGLYDALQFINELNN
jgi:hypothetical protein